MSESYAEWSILELLGHRRLAGFVTEQEIAGKGFLRIDVPGPVSIANRHYSRRKPSSNQFMPPGQTVVLVGMCYPAVFGWWRPHPESGLKAWNNLDGWTCTIFRNEGHVLSSKLILDAERFLEIFSLDCGPDGLLTYVWDSRIRSTNPGFCFLKAGWTRRGRSSDNRKTLLQKLPH